jgi:transposase-like protein
MLERINQEIKRRTRVIRTVRTNRECMRLVSTLMMEVNQEWMGRLYLRCEEPAAVSGESEERAA